jgi:hypothetical protein
VLMTASFAAKPVINAVETRQSEKPIGTNMQLIKRPIDASRLSSLPATWFKRMSKDCKNHIITVARKIIVNAL